MISYFLFLGLTLKHTQIKFVDEESRTISISGAATAPRFVQYGVNPDGSQWTTVYKGADANASAWDKATTDLLGRVIREKTPGFGGSMLRTEYTNDNGGRILSQTVIARIGETPQIISSQLFTYNIYGETIFSALDVNKNDIIDFSGSDQIIGAISNFIIKDGAIWEENAQAVYPDFNSDRAVTTSKQRRKLTNLASFASVSEIEDIHGNIAVSTQSIDRNNGIIISTTKMPTSTQAQINIQSYGLSALSISTSAITNQFHYDGLSRQIARTDGRGNTSIAAYNSLGLVAWTEDAATNRTSFIYDKFGRMLESIDTLGNSTHTAYDQRGNVIKQWGATYPVWNEYDDEGRMIAMTTTRDDSIDHATISDLNHPSLDKTQWVYDPATGLLTQKLYADGKGPSYTYTPDGSAGRSGFKLATRTWARGVETLYSYDAADQLASVSYSDDTLDVSFTYNRLGQQLTAQSGTGIPVCVFEYKYSNFFSLTNETVVAFGTTNSLKRLYDTFSRPASIALRSGGVLPPTNDVDCSIRYAYDDFGRFAAITGMAQPTGVSLEELEFNYSYLKGSHLVSGYTASSGHSFTRNFKHNRTLISAITNAFENTPISSFDYENDGLGRRVRRNNDEFGYNIRSEVTSAKITGNHQQSTNNYSYSYDPIGNRTGFSVIASDSEATLKEYSANELNQYTDIESTPEKLAPNTSNLIYDLDGNMVFDGDGWHYVWDGENRLILASNNTHTVFYAYDHQGRMMCKEIFNVNTVPRKIITYTWDGLNIIAETINTSSGVETSFNLWGLDIDGTLQDAGGVGSLLAVAKDRNIYIPTYDANGNISEYVTLDGVIVAHCEYDVFGNTIAATGTIDVFTHWFSTKPYCEITRLSEYEHRLYSPSIGRWISRDPIEESGGLNLLAFCFNNSVDYIDLLGNDVDTGGNGNSVCTRTAIRYGFDLTDFKISDLAKKIGIEKVEGKLSVESKKCKSCCTRTRQVEESISVTVSGNLIANFGTRKHDFGVFYFRIGWYGRISGAGSINAQYDACKMQGTGSGCITFGGEAGGIVEGGLNAFEKWVTFSVGGRGGANISITACVNCNSSGCKGQWKWCYGATVRLWGKVAARKRSAEIFHEWSASSCSNWKDIQL